MEKLIGSVINKPVKINPCSWWHASLTMTRSPPSLEISKQPRIKPTVRCGCCHEVGKKMKVERVKRPEPHPAMRLCYIQNLLEQNMCRSVQGKGLAQSVRVYFGQVRSLLFILLLITMMILLASLAAYCLNDLILFSIVSIIINPCAFMNRGILFNYEVTRIWLLICLESTVLGN